MSTSLPSFLSEAKKALHEAIEKKDKVTLVIGNETAGIPKSLLYRKPCA